jgi:toxin ParE1/3/4
MAARLKWLRPALNDLSQTLDFISLESPGNAKKINTQIFERANKLKAFPRQGSRFGSFQPNREIRQIYVYSWRVVYEFIENEVHILRIIHMSQDLEKIVI